MSAELPLEGEAAALALEIRQAEDAITTFLLESAAKAHAMRLHLCSLRSSVGCLEPCVLLVGLFTAFHVRVLRCRRCLP